jgi:hypothetical protein
MRVFALPLLAAAVLRGEESSARGLRKRPASFLRRSEQPAEQLVKYSDHGLAMDGPEAPRVDQASWEAALKLVVSAGDSRYVFASDIPQVKAALEKDLTDGTQAATKEEPFDVSFHGKRGQAYNLVSRVQGVDPKKYVLVGAHYDSIPASGPAPGAEDNGSGVATLLSVAKAFKSLGIVPQQSIEFVMFSAEEEGLLGSTAYVADNKDRMSEFSGAIILDEVSFTRSASHRLIFETSGETDGNNRIIDTLAKSAKTAAPDVTYEVNYHGFGSDHMPFLQAGFPAVLVIERDNMWFADKYGHSTRDTVDRVSPDFGSKVASLVAQAVTNLAQTPTKQQMASSANGPVVLKVNATVTH